jgi:hypothetical protein
MVRVEMLKRKRGVPDATFEHDGVSEEEPNNRFVMHSS